MRPDYFKENQFAMMGGNAVCSCCGTAFNVARTFAEPRFHFDHETGNPSYCPNEGKRFIVPLTRCEVIE